MTHHHQPEPVAVVSDADARKFLVEVHRLRRQMDDLGLPYEDAARIVAHDDDVIAYVEDQLKEQSHA